MDIRLKKGTQLALRALQELSRNPHEKWMGVSRLSRRMKVPPSYLAKILGHLSRAGVVDSSAGRAGGYRLTRKWEVVPLSQVIAACENLEKFTVCMLDGKRCLGKKAHCTIHPLWLQLHVQFHQLFERTNLGSLFSREGGALHEIS